MFKKSVKINDGYTKFREVLQHEAAKAIIAFLLVVVIGLVFNAEGAFFKFATHRDAIRQFSVYGILACGMTLVIITGGIDLAVGSTLALVAVVFSLLTIHYEWSPVFAILASLGIGAAVGFISGFLIAKAKLQPFIATLAMMTFVRGLARLITEGKKISTYVTLSSGEIQTKKLPDIFNQIDTKIFGDAINVVSIIFIICIIVTWVLLSKHKWGRDLYAIGGNEEAARLSGVRVNKSKIMVYVYSGLLCAVAGICQAAQETQGDPLVGNGYELIAIEMSVIGGTSMAGGRGGIGLTFFGILTIGYLQKILSINAVPEALRLMIAGVIIVVAVLAQRDNR